MNVNEWFASGPSDTIDMIVGTINQDLKILGFELEIDSNTFKHKLSTALCLLYTMHLRNAQTILSFPKMHVFPLGWDSEKENEWIDFLESNYFDYTYWDSFWSYIPYSHWEEVIHSWREQFQCLIVTYIKRDPRKMKDAEEDLSGSENSDESESVLSQ
jgi:hypothetical protein